MPVIEERYDQNKIDSLKRFLQREESKGKTRDFEIFVDGFKIVSRTCDINEFDDYEDEIKDGSRNMSILIYDGTGTNRNTRYSFSFQDGSPIPARPLNGIGSLGEIDEIIQQKMEEKDRDYKIAALEQELKNTKQQLFEAEEYHVQLQERVTELEAEVAAKPIPSSLNPQLREFGVALVGNLIQKNVPQLSGILNGLMGLPGTSAPVAPPEPPAEATFHKQEEPEAPQMTEQQLRNLKNLEAMERAFDNDQLQVVIAIIERLMHDPQQVIPVAKFLNLHNSNEHV